MLLLNFRSAINSASDSRSRGIEFDTRFGHLLSFLLPLIQEGRLSLTKVRILGTASVPHRRAKIPQECCG